MATVKLDETNLKDTVTANPIVVLDFWAPWCGPCVRFAPTFEKASENHPDIVFAKLNTQDHPGVAGAYGIQAIPTLMVFRDQILIYRQAGALSPAQFEDLLTQVKALDMDDVRRQLEQQGADA
jgi:thioredoxin